MNTQTTAPDFKIGTRFKIQDMAFKPYERFKVLSVAESESDYFAINCELFGYGGGSVGTISFTKAQIEQYGNNIEILNGVK